MCRDTNFTLKELSSAIISIDKMVKNSKCKHKAVRKKYSSSLKSRVALLEFRTVDMNLILNSTHRHRTRQPKY